MFPLLVFLHNFVLPVSLKIGNDRCKPYSMCRESPPQHHRRNGFSWMNYKVAFYKMLGYYQIMSSILSCGLFTNPADKPSFSSLLKSSFIFTTSCLITFAFRFVFKGTAATLFTDFFLISLFVCYLRVKIIIIFFFSFIPDRIPRSSIIFSDSWSKTSTSCFPV